MKFFDHKFLKDVRYTFVEKCAKCEGSFLPDTIKYMCIGWVLFSIPYCMILSATQSSPIEWKHITTRTKVVRILIQLAPLLIIGPIGLCLLKLHFFERNMLELWLHLIYCVTLLGCTMLFYYGIPYILHACKYDINTDWIYFDESEAIVTEMQDTNINSEKKDMNRS